jgi:RNA polymerase sigma-70 factor (ECF subfamily)
MDEDAHLSQIQTMWSMVQRAHGDHTAVQPAQQLLLDRYGGAIHRYALAALRDEDAADEVFQEFAVKFVRGDLGGADPERGRFRAFVKTIVYRLIVDYQRRQKKRGFESPLHTNLAGEVDVVTGPSAREEQEDALFRASWRDDLLARCWAKLAEAECQTGKPHHTVLRFRVDHPDVASPELATGLTEKLGKPINAGAVRVMLHRAREAFADLLLDEVSNSLADASRDEVERELIELELLEYCKPALDRRGEKT